MSPTVEPVTAGGWYERTDGSVGEYRWFDGQVRCARVVACWADVPDREEELEQGWREQLAAKRTNEVRP